MDEEERLKAELARTTKSERAGTPKSGQSPQQTSGRLGSWPSGFQRRCFRFLVFRGDVFNLGF